MNCLYILDINPLSIVSPVHIFSYKFFFCFVDGSFATHKLLSSIWYCLFLFLFLLLWEIDLCQNVLHVFSSRSFMVSYL